MNTLANQEKTIIVATDFSDASLNAAAYAAEMALAVGKELHLLHIVILQVAYGEMMLSINADEMVHDAQDELNKMKQQLAVQTGGKVPVNTEVRLGTFFTELKSSCEQLKPYAVVMGSQGTTAAERMMYGGHTVYAMQHLMWPLITVPPCVRSAAIERIALACDFDNMIYKTPVEVLKKLVKDFKATLHIVNIGKKDVYNPEVAFESGLLQERLKELQPDYHFIINEHIDKSIIEFAEEKRIDLLIVLPKRHNLMDLLTHKSHTKQLVLHANVPVMALHQ